VGWEVFKRERDTDREVGRRSEEVEFKKKIEVGVEKIKKIKKIKKENLFLSFSFFLSYLLRGLVSKGSPLTDDEEAPGGGAFSLCSEEQHGAAAATA
jgi:hypothetical protein